MPRLRLNLHCLTLLGVLTLAAARGVGAEVLPEGTPAAQPAPGAMVVQPEGAVHSASLPVVEEPVIPWPEDLDVPFTDFTQGEVLSLDEVTRMAVANSLNIDIFRLDQDIKREDLPIEESKYDTQLTIEGEYEIDKEQPASTIFGSREVTGDVTTTLEKLLSSGTGVTLTHAARRESTQSPFASLSRLYKGSLEVAVSQPLLRNSFGVIDRAKVQQVTLDIKRFDYETADRIEAEVFTVRNGYWDLVFAHRDLESKRRALRQAQEFLRTTREKLAFGLVERQDVYAAEANVRLRVVDALEAQTVLENRREVLQTLLDLPEEVHVVPGTEPLFEKMPVDVEESLEYAYHRRRDYRQLKLDLEIGDLEVRMKRSGLLPRLDLEASYRSSGLDRDLADAQGEIGGFNHPTIFAGFTFEEPLENRKAKAEFRQARLARRQVELKIKRLKRTIERDIREANREVLLAAARVKQTLQAEILQRNKLVEEGKAFQYGRSDSRTVIDFQEDVIDAETQAQAALVSYRKAQDALWRVEHRLLDIVGVAE